MDEEEEARSEENPFRAVRDVAEPVSRFQDSAEGVEALESGESSLSHTLRSTPRGNVVTGALQTVLAVDSLRRGPEHQGPAGSLETAGNVLSLIDSGAETVGNLTRISDVAGLAPVAGGLGNVVSGSGTLIAGLEEGNALEATQGYAGAVQGGAELLALAGVPEAAALAPIAAAGGGGLALGHVIDESVRGVGERTVQQRGVRGRQVSTRDDRSLSERIAATGHTETTDRALRSVATHLPVILGGDVDMSHTPDGAAAARAQQAAQRQRERERAERGDDVADTPFVQGLARQADQLDYAQMYCE